jgi:hypothetical protein
MPVDITINGRKVRLNATNEWKKAGEIITNFDDLTYNRLRYERWCEEEEKRHLPLICGTFILPTDRVNEALTGWICPRCGRGVAPWYPSCPCESEKAAQAEAKD